MVMGVERDRAGDVEHQTRHTLFLGCYYCDQGQGSDERHHPRNLLKTTAKCGARCIA